MTFLEVLTMDLSMTLVEAKANFSEAVRTAERGEPVFITRHGKPVVALVDASEVIRLKALQAAGPKAGLASIAGGWEGSEELADILSRRQRISRRRGVQLDEP